ncbi:hypothetical protein T310_8725, partial [Rasamsonia emersonii CBS 393.64]
YRKAASLHLFCHAPIECEQPERILGATDKRLQKYRVECTEKVSLFVLTTTTSAMDVNTIDQFTRESLSVLITHKGLEQLLQLCQACSSIGRKSSSSQCPLYGASTNKGRADLSLSLARCYATVIIIRPESSEELSIAVLRVSGDTQKSSQDQSIG